MSIAPFLSKLKGSKDLPFSFQCIIFKKWHIFEALGSMFGEIDICYHWVFCRKLNFLQYLFEAFFKQSILLAAFSPKVNLLFHSIHYNIYLKHNPRSFNFSPQVLVCSKGNPEFPGLQPPTRRGASSFFSSRRDTGLKFS